MLIDKLRYLGKVTGMLEISQPSQQFDWDDSNEYIWVVGTGHTTIPTDDLRTEDEDALIILGLLKWVDDAEVRSRIIDVSEGGLEAVVDEVIKYIKGE